jgi:hypothetical protein
LLYSSGRTPTKWTIGNLHGHKTARARAGTYSLLYWGTGPRRVGSGLGPAPKLLTQAMTKSPPRAPAASDRSYRRARLPDARRASCTMPPGGKKPPTCTCVTSLLGRHVSVRRLYNRTGVRCSTHAHALPKGHAHRPATSLFAPGWFALITPRRRPPPPREIPIEKQAHTKDSGRPAGDP